MADDIKKPEDEVPSTEGDTLEDLVKQRDEEIKTMKEEAEKQKESMTTAEQEKEMMKMEIENLKNPPKPPASEVAITISDTELETLMVDDPIKYGEEIAKRAVKKAKEELLDDPKIKGLLSRMERSDEVQKQQIEAKEVLEKMGRNGENELDKHREDIVKLWQTSPNLSVTEALLRVMAGKGELSVGYVPSQHGVDGVGGATPHDSTYVDDTARESYIQGNIKEKYGLSEKEWAEKLRATKKRQEGR